MPWRLLRKLPGFPKNRRGTVLLLVGLAWVSYGFGVLTDPYPEARFGHVITFLTPFLDSPYTALVWLLCGLVGIAAGFSLLPETTGFSSVVVPPVVWAVLYLWSWVTWLLSGDMGSGRGWVSATAWLALALMVSVTAGWPDSPVDEVGG